MRRIAPRSAGDGGCGIEGVMRAMSLTRARPGRVEAARVCRAAGPRARTRRGAGGGRGLRRLPHRPARGGGRSRAAPRRASCRATRWSGRVAARGDVGAALPRRRPGRRRLAAARLRRLPLLRARARESLPRARSSRAGTPTEATPSSSSFPRPSPIRCPRRSRPSRPRRCCARESSATARTCARASGPAGASGSTASAARRTS